MLKDRHPSYEIETQKFTFSQNSTSHVRLPMLLHGWSQKLACKVSRYEYEYEVIPASLCS